MCEPRRGETWAPEAVVWTDSRQHSSGLELPEAPSSMDILNGSLQPEAFLKFLNSQTLKINICLTHPTRLHFFILCKGTVS
ncbi:hypothetical protein AV530_018211 [Patagioenas fasciata monilis]|uniref:Uncharacterized protein n=1 Tax=Patagioenas fasciata monilis TaxID=372326 RepID=A0A1V4KLA2_PATFA|nr:hypothetical protein AV530_018211 [Patagioenas fasciata monilis]